MEHCHQNKSQPTWKKAHHSKTRQGNATLLMPQASAWGINVSISFGDGNGPFNWHSSQWPVVLRTQPAFLRLREEPAMKPPLWFAVPACMFMFPVACFLCVLDVIAAGLDGSLDDDFDHQLFERWKASNSDKWEDFGGLW